MTANQMSQDASELLFVYGTLMRGFENAKFLQIPEKAHYLGEGKIPGNLFDVGEFPAFVPGAAAQDGESCWVEGEIYFLEDPEAVLATLDIIEGCNHSYPERSLFLRKCLPAYLHEQEKSVWVYVYNQPFETFPRIPGGNYREYCKHREK